MKAALVVNRITNSIKDNINNIIFYINKAADKGADLVVFSETAITGLINDDNPEHDSTLGIPIPGKVTDSFCKAAKMRKINIAIGLFESEAGTLYDSAVFINRNGEIILKYRRMSPSWHSSNAKKDFYKEGNEVNYVISEFGKTCFLICGDLFDDRLIQQVKDIAPDYLIFPFARSFSDKNEYEDRWNKEEMPYYLEQIKSAGVTALMVNYLDDDYFGGAYVISDNGEVAADFSLGKEGILFAEI